ncbi:MAG: hypothetical protein KGZ77_08390 [Rhodobacteraceae bacterium]|nr:hypothetical protein [Paracoccaceae bacterium]
MAETRCCGKDEKKYIRETGEVTYQERVAAWITACFPASARGNVSERSHRFLEEAIELAQASGCTREDARIIVDYVFDRPAGAQEQEVGGVMVTLAALCNALKLTMDDAGDKELARNWERIDAIRRKQASKPVGSPLPQRVESRIHASVSRS